MTASDQVAFATELHRLGEAFRTPVSVVMADEYWTALRDLPLDALERAIAQHKDTHNFFPAIAELRAGTKLEQRARFLKLPTLPPRLALPPAAEPESSVPVKDLVSAMHDYLVMRDAGVSREDAVKGLEGLLRALMPLQRAEPWHVDCDRCDDTGWETRTCFPDAPGRCGVRTCRKRREHTYAVACGCRDSNPTYQRGRRRRFAVGG
jgi:hypothetical protein